MTEWKWGPWIIAGTPVEETYACRCHERRWSDCSPAWCPCAGRSDPPLPSCCGHRFRPADHLKALAEWQAKRDREHRGEV